jgi:photosystem II stability/assembly factor-like uncharacterized protein
MKNIFLLFILGLSSTLFAQSTMWQILPAGITASTASVIDMDAPTRDICWAIGGTDNGAGLCTQPFLQFTRTSNGGQSFTTGTLNIPSGYKPTSISAVDENTAWISLSNTLTTSPGLVYKTIDGGINWLHQSSANFRKLACFVHFYDANEGVAIGDSLIYRTINGGTNWTIAQRIPYNANVPTSFFYNAIETNGDYIWIGNVTGRIFRSADRGKNWIQTSGVVGNALSVKDLAFKDSLNGVATAYSFVSGGNGGGNYTDNGYVYITSDGGNSWTKKYLVFGSVTSWQTGKNFYAKYAVSYIPGTQNTYLLQAAYNHNTCALSHDGGLTWTMIDTTKPLTAIAAIDSNTIYAGSYFTDALSGIYKWDVPIIFPTAIKPISKLPITIFPNPTKHRNIQINLEQVAKNGRLILINQQGKIVYQQNISESTNQNISIPYSLPSGIYGLQINGNQFSVSSQLYQFEIYSRPILWFAFFYLLLVCNIIHYV